MTVDSDVDVTGRPPSRGSRSGRSALPAVESVLTLPAASPLIEQFGRRELRDAVRSCLEVLRGAMSDSSTVPDADQILEQAVRRLEELRRAALRPVINATGVVLHTNLGRAPLSQDAVRAVVSAAGYSTVELDLTTGGRGSRTRHASDLVCRLLAAEDAHVVNNGAAALLLAVAALAGGREILVSRGELIEIGGSFRLPEIIAMSGARLVEVGTTNRTRTSDYRAAIGVDTALILKVHPSNFRQVGFTEEADVSELVALAGEHGISLVHDVGSGLLEHPSTGAVLPALGGEPPARASLLAGVDLVLFSGDKLLGGPQAGILAGSSSAVERCRRSPLSRALRIDKLQVAALETTLAAHLRSDQPDDVPAVRMLNLPVSELRERAERCVAVLAGSTSLVADAVAAPLEGRVGGGASPDASIDSFGITVERESPERLLVALRLGDPTVIARVANGRVILDLRTVAPEDDERLVAALTVAAERVDDASGE